VLEVAAETKTPMIALAPFAPAADKAAWVFQAPQDFGIMAGAVVGHMLANGVKTVLLSATATVTVNCGCVI